MLSFRFATLQHDKLETFLAMTANFFMSPIKTKRTPCEVYSRVVGYLRPVQQWNDGKQAEYNHRKTFKINEN